MHWTRTLILAVILAARCVLGDEIAGHEGHDHGGPPPRELTLLSLVLSAAGMALAVGALLAILWKPIDAAFRRSRWRGRWEKPITRVCFAVGVTALAVLGLLVGLAGCPGSHEPPGLATEPPPLRPLYGGEVTRAGRFAVEMVVRRTGELRMYLAVIEGEAISSWDVQAQVSVVPPGQTGSEEGHAPVFNPLRLDPGGAYFVTMLPPPRTRTVKARLQLQVREQSHELIFQLPVRD